jgi:hypothetical protein
MNYIQPEKLKSYILKLDQYFQIIFVVYLLLYDVIFDNFTSNI